MCVLIGEPGPDMYLRILSGVPSVGSVGGDGGGVASGLVESGRVVAVMSMALSKEGAVGVKGSRVWLGDGLGTVPKKMYEKMVK